MFGFIGADAVSGGLKKIQDLVTKSDPNAIQYFFESALSKYKDIPVIGFLASVSGDIKAGYDAMSPEQKAEFWKNCMVAGAKLAAKV
jgi:hypothetical protein